MIPRLHQSIAKFLVTECPAVAKAKFDEEQRKPTRQMEKGTLVDQLVFGGANFHVIDSVYKSGDRKGQPVDDLAGGDAKVQAKEARERGMVPCLPHELERAQTIAGGIKARLLAEGIDLKQCETQVYIEWTGSTGCPCAGTLDLKLPGDRDTADLKLGYTANPDRLEYHLYDQGWHIQAAAYQDAIGKGGLHWLIVGEAKSGADCITIAPLSEAYMDIGRKAWERAQRIWVQCWATNEWPEYTARPLMPPKSVLFKEGLAQ